MTKEEIDKMLRDKMKVVAPYIQAANKYVEENSFVALDRESLIHAFIAGVAHERARSEKLVNALESIFELDMHPSEAGSVLAEYRANEAG